MDFDLGRYLPYLISRVGPAVERGFWENMSFSGLTLEEWRVIAVLHADAPLTLNQLAEGTSVKASTLSRLVGRMAARGLISRRRSGKDSRTVSIVLLKRGREKAERLIPHCLAYEAAIVGNFTAEEEAELRRLLNKLYRVLSTVSYDPSIQANGNHTGA